MKKRNKKHEKRVRKLILTCALCAIILTVSTYAWFIGMMTVNVSSFDVQIAAIDGLSLSLDAQDWHETVSISEDTYKTPKPEDVTPVYEGNKNSWGGKGLIPMSSVGEIDTASSRMKLYEKGSLTTTPGGYRLMASLVENADEEQPGYVAFDLFIKNLSGTEYYKELNEANEEAIYLTTDSKVEVSNSGVNGTGIENSVRVAFAQIGRVVATTPREQASIITGISCGSNTDVTGICSSRVAQIWEPNDTKHVANAISWYETSCQKRTAGSTKDPTDVTDPTNYSGSKDCNTVANDQSYPTYAVRDVIDYKDNVDVYDGAAYNGYIKSVNGTQNADNTVNDGKLYEYPYFTDTMKDEKGTNRPTFITLAPNSITKVRIYIYLEGQDIDNYDFASIGRQISVQFGFTKERYIATDIDYDGDEVIDNVTKENVTLPTPIE